MKSLYIILFLFCASSAPAQITFSVYFDFNQFLLTNKARMSLDSFLQAEKLHLPAYLINLHGHCDSIGPDNFNDQLSAKRVGTVKKYLVSKGIAASAIVNEISHGKKDPVYENMTEKGRGLNRRVELSLSKVAQTHLSGTEPLPTLTERIADTATKAGTTITLNNINFYGGSPLPLPEAFTTLDELLGVMKVNYNLVIEIRGHICCVTYSGDTEYRSTGNGLSEERARTVHAYLVGNGIEASRVSYKGFGHSEPIYPYPEKTEEERTANRRVEIKIISK
jgi:outer membrane protein OmpA-like peptidoglycan-associated protein